MSFVEASIFDTVMLVPILREENHDFSEKNLCNFFDPEQFPLPLWDLDGFPTEENINDYSLIDGSEEVAWLESSPIDDEEKRGIGTPTNNCIETMANFGGSAVSPRRFDCTVAPDNFIEHLIAATSSSNDSFQLPTECPLCCHKFSRSMVGRKLLDEVHIFVKHAQVEHILLYRPSIQTRDVWGDSSA
jgi:hypothetical protein